MVTTKLRPGRKSKIKVGDVFGRLTVEKFHGKGKLGVILWECKCSCGNTTIVRNGNLNSKHTSSCGCLKTEGNITSKPGHAGCQKLFQNYKNSAAKRHLEFNISRDEFIEVITKNCFYCDSPPNRISSVKVNSPEAELNSRFLFNGIDRLNSKLGYISGNCVACCYDCNVAKFENTPEEFYQMILKIYTNLVKTGRITAS